MFTVVLYEFFAYMVVAQVPFCRLAFFKAAYALFDSDFYVKADDDIYLRPGDFPIFCRYYGFSQLWILYVWIWVSYVLQIGFLFFWQKNDLIRKLTLDAWRRVLFSLTQNLNG